MSTALLWYNEKYEVNTKMTGRNKGRWRKPTRMQEKRSLQKEKKNCLPTCTGGERV
jgi:hypothetical protein